jgi:hypothetical protein
MDSVQPGDRVNVVTETGSHAAIVFDTPSRTKVVVAIVAGGRGPAFRTVNPKLLSERNEDAADDTALRLLIKRSPPPARGSASAWTGAGHGRAGHARGSMHRTTGK